MTENFTEIPDQLAPVAREHFLVARQFLGEFTRQEFISKYREEYPDRAEQTIFPSDFCFNKNNKGNIGYPRFLKWINNGRYEFVGLVDAIADPEVAGPQLERAMTSASAQPLNQILYGPPGTGKTYSCINKALEILDPEFAIANSANRSALKERYDELCDLGRIKFVTFHQSFAYEDFVEGLRADRDDDGQLTYKVEDGVFKLICASAAARRSNAPATSLDLTGRRIWKMSLGNTLGSDSYIYDECIEQNQVLLGYGYDIDFSSAKSRSEAEQLFKAAGRDGDGYPASACFRFAQEMKVGDLVVVSDGNQKFRAFAEVAGDYKLLPRREDGEGYRQARDVRWLAVFEPSLPASELMRKNFSQMTLYELSERNVDLAKLSDLLGSGIPAPQVKSSRPFQIGQQFGRDYEVEDIGAEVLRIRKPNGSSLPLDWAMLDELASLVRAGKITTADIANKEVFDKVETRLEKYIVHGYQNIIPLIIQQMLEGGQSTNAGQEVHSSRSSLPPAWVLIIDEINRGNISRVFGELITLIEPSKRAGNAEALATQLPYSKTQFSVPNNVYIIGTMNTADRSLSGLDIALRRRFVFEELPPRPELLNGIEVDGVSVERLLRTMNDRIEVLLDRDHRLGHAYFLSLRDNATLSALSDIFARQVIPLLQEYFFDDWERIRWVLNDHRKPDTAHQFIVKPNADLSALLGNSDGMPTEVRNWNINEGAFRLPESYHQIIQLD